MERREACIARLNLARVKVMMLPILGWLWQYVSTVSVIDASELEILSLLYRMAKPDAG